MKKKAKKDAEISLEVSEQKGETAGDQQQKETRTKGKHDAAKKKRKVADPEASLSRKSQRLKDKVSPQVSPSSPRKKLLKE